MDTDKPLRQSVSVTTQSKVVAGNPPRMVLCPPGKWGSPHEPDTFLRCLLVLVGLLELLGWHIAE